MSGVKGMMYGYGEWCQKDDVLGLVSGVQVKMYGYDEWYQKDDVLGW